MSRDLTNYYDSKIIRDVVFPLLALSMFAYILPSVMGLEIVLGYKTIAPTILIWIIVALAYNFLLGYTGLLSFGHAAFLGTAMYLTAIPMANFSQSVDFNLFILSVLVAVVTTTVVGYLIARLIADMRGIYFSMLTLAFAQIFWYIVKIDPNGLTNGSKGLFQHTLPVWITSDRGRTVISIFSMQINYYWIVAVLFVLITYGLYRLVRSPFGQTIIALRENEELARSIGVDTSRYKVRAFTISVFVTAIGGVLLLINSGSVSMSVLNWENSGDIVLMTVLGGSNNFSGPIVGAFFWQYGSQYIPSFELLHIPLAGITINLGDYVQYWRGLFGLIFMIIVIIAPGRGIWGIIKGGVARLVNWSNNE